MKKILVTAIGSMAADMVIKTLHGNGHCVVGTDIYPKEWVVDARNVEAFYNVPRVDDERLYVDRLKEICLEQQIEYLMPLTDVEIDVLNANRNQFQDVAILCISGYETIRMCRNKRETSDFLRQKSVCHTVPIYSDEEMESLKVMFPVVAKPADGRSSQGLRIFQEQEAAELQSFYSRVHGGRYLFQPYLAGNVVTVDVVRNRNTNQCVAAARREMLRTLNGAGLSVQVFRDAALEQNCMDIAKALDIHGCVNFEFIETEDQTRYFMECNPRFSGGVKFSALAGYDFVTNHLRCFEGVEIETPGRIQELYMARKYEEYITG